MINGRVFFKGSCELVAFDPDQSDAATMSTCVMRQVLEWGPSGASIG